MNKDLTEGQPERVLWSFCLPLFGSIIFQQLYNIADSLIAGKLVGETHWRQWATAMRSPSSLLLLPLAVISGAP